MDFQIQGKKALVCAGSKGLGKAIALSLAAEGVELFVCSRSQDAIESAIGEIQSIAFQPVHAMTCDLSDFDERAVLIQKVNEVFDNTLDILIHNTGGPPPSTVEETKLDDWEAGFNRLFMSVAHLNEAFVPGMKAQGWGRILVVTSSSVLEPIDTIAVSNAMRSAVTSMMKTLSDPLAPHGVTVNCLAPGVIHTDRTEQRITNAIERNGGTREDYLKQYASSVPMGRLGESKEFGDAAAFLCSQQASYITGSTISVDGGKRRSTY